MRGDTAARADFYVKMASINALKVNEIRGYENLPPVEGGDTIAAPPPPPSSVPAAVAPPTPGAAA